MPGRLEGKVAFITGAARGQGRAHAIAMAKEGADIIAVDICRQIDSNPYPLATPDDLAETERSIKELGRRVVARIADVRERHELRDAVEAGVADLGRIDIVVANAGILPMAMGKPDPMQFVDASDVDLVGVMNTVAVTIPHLPEGSSIIVTGSTAGMIRGTTDNPNMGPGGAGYGWSKRIVMEYVEEMCLHLAPRMIRVNAIHPTNCNTNLLQNDGMYSMFRPDLTPRARRPPGRTPNRCSRFSRPCPSRTSSQRTWPTSGCSWPATRSRYITGQQIRVERAHCSSGPTRLYCWNIRFADVCHVAELR